MTTLDPVTTPGRSAEALVRGQRGPMSSAYRWLTVALLALVTIIAFEAMAISTAMPSVAKDLDAGRVRVCRCVAAAGVLPPRIGPPIREGSAQGADTQLNTFGRSESG